LKGINFCPASVDNLWRSQGCIVYCCNFIL